MSATIRRLALLGVMTSLVCGSLAQQPAKPVLSAAPDAAGTAPASGPVAGPALAPAGTEPVNVDPNYVIGASDSIMVNVWKEPTWTENVLVRPDGMISLPAIGDVAAAGRTPMQLSDQITTLLKKYVIDPNVTVSVLAVNSKKVYLVGEVGHIGPLAMTPNMTVLQAIASSGGLTAFAQKKKIYILRKEQGKEQKIPFNYTKAVKDGDNQGVTLVPDDTIVVP